MIDFDIKIVKCTFVRLFVLALGNDMHPTAFTHALEKSEFLQKIEADKYDDYFNKPVLDVFEAVTGNKLSEDNGFGIYNDAYWSAVSYFDLHLKTNKPFSYLFLKLPLEKMLDMYDVYHEMDFSSLLERFNELEKEKTILRALCEEKHVSLSKISKGTGISVNTLMKYNASDNALYKASFQNVIEIATFLEVPLSLFKEKAFKEED